MTVIAITCLKRSATRADAAFYKSAEVEAFAEIDASGVLHGFYVRRNGRGVVMLLNVKGVVEARILLDGLPLTGAGIATYKTLLVDLVDLVAPGIAVGPPIRLRPKRRQ